VAVYNIQTDILNKQPARSNEQVHILMIGPTGTGKTCWRKRCRALLDVPFAIVDPTSYRSGHVGEDVEKQI